MIRKSIISAAGRPFAGITCLILGLAISLTNDGCKPSCDSLPGEQPLTGVRILNAVSNVKVLLIYMDGKLFDRAYYNLPDYSANGTNFTYRNTFISDGSTMRAGRHYIVAIASGGEANGKTVFRDTCILYNHLQSIECIGKFNGTLAQTPTTIYLDDDLRTQVSNSYARFIDAVPDLGGVDVYFDNVAKLPQDIRIDYGKISDAQGGDNGTGLSANDYYRFPDSVPGLTITPIGDTSQADFIANFPYSLQTNSLLETIVVRGETEPSGDEPTVSIVLIEDGGQGGKTYSTELQTSGIRLINASHYDSVTLMIADPTNKDPARPRTVTNHPYTTQQKVTNIKDDSVSSFMALSPNVPYYKFWFGHTAIETDTVFRFTTNQQDAFTPVIPTLVANGRYTFIAIDTIKDDAGNAGISLLEMLDTVSSPVNSAMGRVCFVNTSADYIANFTFAGQTFKMKQRDVKFVDAPKGPYSFQVTDVGTSGTVSFNVVPGTPTTVFFMPSNANSQVPYSISTQ